MKLDLHQKGLLFSTEIEVNDLVQNGSCALCESVNIPAKLLHHAQIHAKTCITLKGVTIRGCRLASDNCWRDKSKMSRYHYHCPTITCLTAFTMKNRLQNHVEKCWKGSNTDSEIKEEEDNNSIGVDSGKIPTEKTSENNNETGKFVGLSGHKKVNEANNIPPTKKSKNKVTSEKSGADGGDTCKSSEKLQCSLCNEVVSNTNMSRHIKRWHTNSDAQSLTAMLVHPYRKIFVVRHTKSGVGKPVHVEHSTVPGDMKADCSDKMCKTAKTVAHNSMMVSHVCEHMAATRTASIQNTEIFADFSLDFAKELNFSDNSKKTIEEYYNHAAGQSLAPVIKIFMLKRPEIFPRHIYFSVFEKEFHGSYSPFGRLVTTLDTKMLQFSCDCKSKSCIHVMITRAYIAQIWPELLLDPMMKKPLNNEEHDTVPRTAAFVSTQEFQVENNDGIEFEQIRDISDMIDYMLHDEDIQVPFQLKINMFDEKIPESIKPNQSKCFRCGNENLLERKLQRHCKVITTLSAGTPVPIYVKDCPKCGMVTRHQDWHSGFINYNNFIVTSIVLLEDIIHHNLHHMPMQDVLKMYEHQKEVVYIYDDINNCLNFYLSLKNIPFRMSCGVCGTAPNFLIFDTLQKFRFDIEKMSKLNASPLSKPKYNTYREFYKDVRKSDLARGLTKDPKILRRFKLQYSRDWLPFVGADSVVEPQPPSHRIPHNLGAKNPHPIDEDRLFELLDKKHTKDALIKWCKELGIRCSGLRIDEMKTAIINAGVCFDKFAEKFFELTGKSGGVLRGLCEHGVVFVTKVLLWPEGAADYGQALLSITLEHLPGVIAVDFAPQVAAHLNKIDPDFLYPHGGKLVSPTEENIAKVIDGELIDLPGIIPSPLLGLPKDRIGRFIVIDEFHKVNHTSDTDYLHYQYNCKQLRNARTNTEIVEQRNKFLNKFNGFSNNKNPDRFIKFFVYLTEYENNGLNKDLKSNLERRLGRSLCVSESTGLFVPEDWKSEVNVLNDNIPPSTLKRQTFEEGDDKKPSQKQPKVVINEETKNQFDNLDRAKRHGPAARCTAMNYRVRLPNPARYNLCWLNAVVHLIMALELDGAIREACQDRHYPIKDFFTMLNDKYNSDAHLQFAEAVIEVMRDNKITMSEKKYYVMGEPQDITEVLQSTFYPAMMAADIIFHHDLLIHFKTSIIEFKEMIFELCTKDKLYDYIFVQVIRTDGKKNKNLTFLSDDAFSCIVEMIEINDHTSYHLDAFICYSGAIELGHYVTYHRDVVTNVKQCLDGKHTRSIGSREYLKKAAECSQLLVYKYQPGDDGIDDPPEVKVKSGDTGDHNENIS